MFWSLRSKLLMPILAVLLLASATISVFSYTSAGKALRVATVNDAKGSLQRLGDVIELIVSAAEMDVRTMGDRDSVRKLLAENDTASAQIIEAQMKKTIEIQSFYTSMTILNNKGIIVASSSGSTGGDRADRDYFIGALAGKFMISKPSVSKTTNAAIVVISTPAYDKNKSKVIGVSAAVLNLRAFSDRYVAPIKLCDNGFAMVVDSKGVIVAHRDTEQIAKTLANPIQEQIKNMSSDTASFSLITNGKETHYFAIREKQSGWVGIVLAEDADLYSEVNAMAMFSALLTLVSVVCGFAVVYFVVYGITKALKTEVDFARAVAAGDLEQTLDLARHDEIGMLADSLRIMVKNLKAIIITAEQKTLEALQQSEKASEAMSEAEQARSKAESARSEGMHQAAGQLDVIATALSSTAKEMLALVGDAASGADLQRQGAISTASSTEQMNLTGSDIACNASQAVERADNAKVKAEIGSRLVQSVVIAISEVSTKSEASKSQLQKLSTTSQSIGRVLDVISDIADQTNLLALNAAIEAARAGDAGRGFAVVADEVRKLAEKTMQATKEVGSAVKAIQKDTEVNISYMEEATKAVERSNSLSVEAGDALHEIVELSEKTAEKIRSIATASEEQSATSAQISSGIEELRQLADSTAKNMGLAKDTVNSLTKQASSINLLVDEFKKS